MSCWYQSIVYQSFFLLIHNGSWYHINSFKIHPYKDLFLKPGKIQNGNWYCGGQAFYVGWIALLYPKTFLSRFLRNKIYKGDTQ
ncbi:hypothetical protein BDF20DRAFT_847541 [Mycotypha africana]|uniref:uncharacterized protein n=1 Tax=Mycotypha africana TaxID=64632 RepID=UPI00230068C5|nr:uncharacterized protein BDF20DRAFT_847541 [Mycotypha africana]KAI8991965.1 hypothetical protein BDF20DRAFT_847541 [Mycotypha africana]